MFRRSAQLPDRPEVDVHERGDERPAPPDAHGLLDVGRELELVLEVLGREEGAVDEPADVPGPVDDPEVAVLVDDPRVPRVDPAVLQRLPRGLGVLVVAGEDARAPVQDLARVADPQLDARQRRSHRVELHVAVLLDAHQRARLRHAVELLHVDAERAVELEQLRADRLARGIGHADTPHAQVVAQGAVDEHAADLVQHAIAKGNRARARGGAAPPAGRRRGRSGPDGAWAMMRRRCAP